jgi:hypothetical protein
MAFASLALDMDFGFSLADVRANNEAAFRVPGNHHKAPGYGSWMARPS